MVETKDRDFLGNAALFLVSVLGFIFVPGVVASALNYLFKGLLSYNMLSILGSSVYILIMFLFYYKDIVKEAKTFKETFKESFFKGLKCYFIGLLVMILSNVIISFVLRDVSANENEVRNLLYDSPFLTMISIVVTAPLTEELLFRKSLMPLFKNKWLYAFCSALLFGGAHLIAGLDTFKILDLLYLIPYGSLGFAFAYANYETKTTFTSISIHALHNFLTGIMLLLLYFKGMIK